MSQSIKYYCIPGTAGTATAATEVTNKGGYLNLAGQAATIQPDAFKMFPISLTAVKNGNYKAYAAEVLRIVTITPTAVAGGEYRVTLSAEKDAFDTNLPNEVQTTFTHTAPSGATATTIGDAFRTAINNHPFWNTRVTASGTTTLVLTAKAGYPIFTAGVGQYMAAVYTTGGSKVSGGTGAALLATGNFNSVNGLPVGGSNYSVIAFESNSGSNSVISGQGDAELIYIYFLEAGNNTGMATGLKNVLVK